MKPDREIIERFQRLYLEEFGEKISEEEAYEKFLRLVNLLRVILKPASKNDHALKDPEFDSIPENGKLKKYT